MITVNIGLPVFTLPAADQVILQPLAPVLREAIQNAIAYNTTGGALTLDFYESPDATSASGVLFSKTSIPANSSVLISDIVSQGFDVGQNLIAVASGAGLEFKVTITRTET